MLQRILEFLEPKDVYEQSYLPRHKQSFRMQLSHVFYFLFRKYL